jgi:hypothetical protein
MWPPFQCRRKIKSGNQKAGGIVSCLAMDYTALYSRRKKFITTAVRTSNLIE